VDAEIRQGVLLRPSWDGHADAIEASASQSSRFSRA
jgi:hypothetical protein